MIAEYLTKLVNVRNDLAKNLNTMGVQASSNETFSTLVPKVLKIKSGAEGEPLTLESLDFSVGNIVITPEEGKAYSDITIVKPLGLSPDNIRQGVNIAGIEGTLEEGLKDNGAFIAMGLDFSDTSMIQAVAEPGYGWANISIMKPDNLSPENIKENVTIAGIKGTLKEGITPTGTLTIRDNKATVDVSSYASVYVDIPTELPSLYPVQIAIENSTLTITDTSNGRFGDGYIVYANGVQVHRATTIEDTFVVNLDDAARITVGDYNITVTIFDQDGFNNSAASNSVLWKMPGWHLEDSTAILEVDYNTHEFETNSGTFTKAVLI